MTLDEAIIHAKEMAEDQDMKAGFETDNQAYAMSEAEREVYKMGAEEQRQLAEWLKELRERKQKCKWIRYDHRTICPKNHDIDNPYWRIPEDRMDTLKYCPYCGKEIEVTE